MATITKTQNFCYVYNCGKQNIKMYHFPNPKTQMQRFLEWFKACKNSYFNSLTFDAVYKIGYICQEHFKDLDFIPCSDKKLHKWAIPSLNLPTDVDYTEPVFTEAVDLPNGAPDKALTDIDLHFDLPLKDLPFLQPKDRSRGNKTLGRALDRFLDSKLSACAAPPAKKPGRKPKLKPIQTVEDLTEDDPDVMPEFEPIPTLICRLCLCHTIRAFSILENPIIIHMLESLTLIKMLNTGVLPTVICLKCFLNLKLAFNIQQKLLKVEQTLQEKLKEIESAQFTVENKATEVDQQKSNDQLTQDLDIDKSPCQKKRKINLENDEKNCKMKSEKCPKCDKEFKNLKNHLKSHNKDSSQCEICGVLLAPEELSTHKIHKHADFTYQCRFCSKSFGNDNGKILHEATEHNVKPNFVCCVCGRRFFLLTYLKTHLELKHFKKRPLLCNSCKNSSELLDERIYLNVIPFECDICERRFKNEDFFKKHLSTKHGVTENFVYKCLNCGEKITSDDDVVNRSS